MSSPVRTRSERIALLSPYDPRCIAMVSRALTGELHLASRIKTFMLPGERKFLDPH
jgi:hypothetical protein